MITEKQIRTLVEQHLEGTEIFVVEVSVKSGNRISVFLDGDHGVTIEVCQKINHHINAALDRDAEDFDLTVSSAGADRPLKLARQYRKNIGKLLDVQLSSGEKFTGTVLSAGEASVELEVQPAKKSKKETEVKILSLNISDIKSAKEVINFKH